MVTVTFPLLRTFDSALKAPKAAKTCMNVCELNSNLMEARRTDFVMSSAQSLCFLLFPILKTWCVLADCLPQLLEHNVTTNTGTVVHQKSAYPQLNQQKL